MGEYAGRCRKKSVFHLQKLKKIAPSALGVCPGFHQNPPSRPCMLMISVTLLVRILETYCSFWSWDRRQWFYLIWSTKLNTHSPEITNVQNHSIFSWMKMGMSWKYISSNFIFWVNFLVCETCITNVPGSPIQSAKGMVEWSSH